jgi:hypothetical protein
MTPPFWAGVVSTLGSVMLATVAGDSPEPRPSMTWIASAGDDGTVSEYSLTAKRAAVHVPYFELLSHPFELAGTLLTVGVPPERLTPWITTCEPPTAPVAVHGAPLLRVSEVARDRKRR